jgi:glutathione peroxidase
MNFKKTLIFAVLLCFQPALRASQAANLDLPLPHSLYDIKVKNIAGKEVSLSIYKGKVLVIVNVASHCGFTPQYAALQDIYQKHKTDHFEILAFPSNDFHGQEPGSNDEIKKFCETKYNVSFPLFDKNPVSGPDKQVLYQWLVANDPNKPKPEDVEVKWNFEKFLISRDGKVLARFRSPVKPDSKEFISAVDSALKANQEATK